MDGKGFQEGLLTTAEVAKCLRIAPRTVCTWAECNELPAIKVGRQWRFRRANVMQWLEHSTPQPERRGATATAAETAPAAYTSPRRGVSERLEGVRSQWQDARLHHSLSH